MFENVYDLKNFNRSYIFKGAVFSYGKILSSNWQAKTRAPSYRRAISNLKYRFRSENGYKIDTPIDFDGFLNGLRIESER